MANWYPSVLTYKEFAQANTFFTDVTGSINRQTKQIKSSIEANRSAIDDQTKQIVASNSQIVSALEKGFDHIAQINEQGFGNVTSAIEALHSDLNYNFGILIQRMEYQNKILSGILKTIQAPFETQVREYYSKACDLANGGILDKAVEYFKKSISLPTGEIFFPSLYQLGRLYLTGVDGEINIIDPKIASENLLTANKYGTGILRTNPSFKSILADCKFFLSQSFYFQLRGNRNSQMEKELINKALTYGDEAVTLNPQLSQGYYFLAKYNAYVNNIEEMKLCLSKAIRLDRNYSIHIFNDAIFEPHTNEIRGLLSFIRKNLDNNINPELLKAKKYLETFQSKGISRFPDLHNEYIKLEALYRMAETDYNTGTYFGIDDCRLKLEEL